MKDISPRKITLKSKLGLLLGLLFLSSSLIAQSEKFPISYLYSKANVGQSSGGHSAFRIGDSVYHFQLFPDHVFHLVRESFFDYYSSYVIFENRSLVETRLRLPVETEKELSDGFNLYFITQEKRLQNLNLLQEEAQFLDELLSPEKRVSIRGLGYFRRKHSSDTKLLDRWFSENSRILFLSKRNEIRNRLLTSQYWHSSQIPVQGNPKILEYEFVESELVNQWKADLEKEACLSVLLDTWEPRRDLFIQQNPEIHLSQSSLRSVSEFRNREIQIVSDTILYGTGSWGKSCLRTLARIAATDETLRTGQPVFLDTSSTDQIELVPTEIADHKRQFLKVLKEQSEWKFQNRLEEDSYSIDEIKYSELEAMANWIHSLSLSEKGFPVGIHFEKHALPNKPGTYIYSFAKPKEKEIKRLYGLARDNLAQYQSRMETMYPFHLIQMNCTTQIFDTIQLLQKEHRLNLRNLAKKEIDPHSSLAFIPFVSSATVQERWPVEKVILYPSYRLQNLQKWNPDFLESILETSTFTSTIYHPNRKDDPFLFFTDDTIIWRPIRGLANLGFGLGLTAYGVFTSPFDGGENFKAGIRSSFFSFPELIFFNIRKGSFPYLTPNQVQKRWETKEEADKHY